MILRGRRVCIDHLKMATGEEIEAMCPCSEQPQPAVYAEFLRGAGGAGSYPQAPPRVSVMVPGAHHAFAGFPLQAQPPGKRSSIH